MIKVLSSRFDASGSDLRKKAKINNPPKIIIDDECISPAKIYQISILYGDVLLSISFSADRMMNGRRAAISE